MDGPQRSDGLIALGGLLEHALHRLAQRPSISSGPAPATVQTDGFIFSGNRHDAIPRALLLDRRLTPLERNAWQVFRLLLNDDGVTAFPTYDQLSPYLTAIPCAERASHETVARTLTLLRLTRWISLVRRHRDPKTGRIRGNLYVLHDEPLTPYEAIQLDADYLDLVSQALAHASKSIQRVGMLVLKEMTEDDLLRHQVLPTRLRMLTQRLAAQGWAASYPQAGDNADSEEGESPGKTSSLRNPKTDRTVRIKEKNEPVRTVPHAQGALRFPERFAALKHEQQSGALAAMQAVDAGMRQAILDEWDARCRDSAVRTPAGYLFGIIQKALRGEFRAWAGKDHTVAPSHPLSGVPQWLADPATAQDDVDQFRATLRSSRHPSSDHKL